MSKGMTLKSFMIRDSLFDILRFNIVLAEMMINAYFHGLYGNIFPGFRIFPGSNIFFILLMISRPLLSISI